MATNPAWQPEELILALELYLTNAHARQVKSDPAVTELSLTLQELDLGIERRDPEKFRNVDGCYMKLQNFKHLDPNYGEGLSRGVTQHMRELWDRFENDPEALAEAAMSIRANGRARGGRSTPPSDEDEGEVLEGKLLLRIHKDRERRRGPDKKRDVLNRTGRLACEVCGFDFAETYGDLGEGYAECHHKLPLYAGERPTRLSDLAIVCANCHRMLHRGRELLSVDGLRARIHRSGSDR